MRSRSRICDWSTVMLFLVLLGAMYTNAEEDPLVRQSRKAGVTVTVTPLPLWSQNDEGSGEEVLRFRISMDTHAGTLLGYDIAGNAVLRTDQTEMSGGFDWVPLSESSHHRTGILRVRNFHENRAILHEGSAFLELDFEGDPRLSRTFRWPAHDLILLLR